MVHAILINSQDPLRAVTPKPSGCGFYNATGYEVIAVPMLIRVLVISREGETLAQMEYCPRLINTCVFVRQAKNLAE